MKIIIETHVPYLHGILEPYAEVVYLEPEKITPAAVRDVDALIIRTRTRCDAELLDGSNVKFIATATIGLDHIDTAYCDRAGIYYTNCPGCNAKGVCQYVEAAINELGMFEHPESHTIGIIGIGHVGSLVTSMADARGMNILQSDPPKNIGVSLDEIAEKCDIITFHTPLDKEGEFATYHMADKAFFAHCMNGATIINAARGGIIDEAAALDAVRSGKIAHFVIDTWEEEPYIHQDFMNVVDIATFHIAGYTQEGKHNASQMSLDALCKYFSLPSLLIEKIFVPLHADSGTDWIRKADCSLRSFPEGFEQLRKQYKLR